ncbi:MAG: hypothetical protein B2I17_00930 [Thermoplasmatales archaeon B_DKE]|nr:MAG: hypothetical protein B2I17_00930 [Thermoplasmatales archaeon B_DKE]
MSSYIEEIKVRVERYIRIEEEALSKLRTASPGNSFGGRIAANFLEMINSYFSDAKHFYDQGDYLNAFAALNYSYGWIDSGIRIGIFDGGEDHRLFTLLE